MKLLVVFDKTPKAEQNLRAALKTTQLIPRDKPELRSSLQVRVCVLSLLPEDRPLDSYLGEVEQAEQVALRTARQIIAQEKVENVSLELLKGRELEATAMIAQRAKEWQADQIYLSSVRDCFSCKKAGLASTEQAAQRFFRVFGMNRKTTPTTLIHTNLPGLHSSVEISDLLKFSGSQIVLTCHGEVNLAVQKHHAQAATRCDRIVYERV